MKQRVKEVVPRSNDQSWANGCKECRFGIVAGADILGAFPISEGRAVQAHEEMIVFCNCRAGHMYRQCLRKIYATLGLELRRSILAHIATVSMPTVHGVTP